MMAPKVLVRRLDRMVKVVNEAFLLPCRHVALCCEGGVRNILKQKSFARFRESATKGRDGHGITEHSCRRRRPRNAGVDRKILAYQRLQRHDSDQRTQEEPGVDRPPGRSPEPPCEAAGPDR